MAGEDRLVGKVMRRQVVKIDPSAKVEEAARLMDHHNVSSLVVSEGSHLRGILTEHDILVYGTAHGKHPGTTTVEEVMRHDEQACRDDDCVGHAARLMADRRLLALPVTDAEGTVIGTLSLLDVAGTVMPQAATAWIEQVRKKRQPEPTI